MVRGSGDQNKIPEDKEARTEHKPGGRGAPSGEEPATRVGFNSRLCLQQDRPEAQAALWAEQGHGGGSSAGPVGAWKKTEKRGAQATGSTGQ